jgi:multidrug efflux pump subunit AcrA (membrane-fusion protein)/Zn-dependent protease
MSSLRTSLLLPFILLTILVVTLHELGHAFTLKHYGGIVPEVGVMIRFFFPAAYTNTTDSYCLVKRRQRGLVVGAGVLCQIIIWAMGLWLWNLSSSGTWLSTTSYLLMVAALFTVAINLNPLTKFDGYYLAVALSGINNLRSRSFGFYANLLSWRPIQENRRDALVLAAYAPFSLAYTLLVFGHLFGWLGDWSLTNIPFWTLTLLTLWAIYFYWPNSTNPASITMNSTNSDSYPLKPRTTPPLQVVQPRTKPAAPTTPADSTASQPSTPAKSYRGWAIFTIVAISLGMMSFIPTSFEVGGPVELETREGARAVVRTPMAGVVAEIHVKPGESVQRGQVLAQLSSWELDRDITVTEQQLAQVRQNLQESRQEFIRAQAQLIEVKAVAQRTQKKATRERDRAAILTQGQLTPEIQVLETQRQRLQERIPEVEDKARRYQELHAQGVISQDRRDEVRFELRDLQSALAAKTQEIEAAKQRLKDTASDLQSETVSQQASIDASRMIADAEGQMAAGRDAIATLEHRLAQLKILRENLTLRSPMTGVVLTNDLDLRRNQELKPGAEFLLEIADLNDLTATVEVKEEDLEYVHLNKPVTFRPRQAKLRPYNATVKMILPKIQSDPTKPHRVARVQIVVNNSDGKLFPGASGYAKIWSEQIPLSQRLGREFQRLIPLERFLWGEPNNSPS